jgi:hypothetical protein
MRRIGKLLSSLGVVLLLVATTQQAQGWWMGPGYGPWRHAYVHDPAYRWGSPMTRQYIRNLHLYGPAYAEWKRLRTWWW